MRVNSLCRCKLRSLFLHRPKKMMASCSGEKECRVLDKSDEESDFDADNEVKGIMSKWTKAKSATEEPVAKKLKKTDSSAPELSEDVDAWTVEDVQKWLIGNGFKEECELFRAEKICGKALKAVDRADLKEMGLTTGRRILLLGQIQDLFGSSYNSSSTEQKRFDSFSTPFDRLLTQSEKKKLAMEEKGIYNTKKKMIIAEVCKQWPEEEETPWFGKNSTEGGKLMSFIDRLANDERFTFPKYGLGRNAIKDMTLTHMRERRRAQKDATLLGSTSGESTVSPSSAEDSSSGSTPPPSLFDKKRKQYVSYFNPELSQVSCNCIVMSALEKPSIEKIQRAKELEKLKKLFHLSLLRGKDKNTYVRAIATALVQHGYVKINDDANLANLKRDEVKLVKNLEL